ncbi:MAG: MAPEG family protein [Chloroflexota bacterium]
MKTELYYLALSATLTGLLWVPYVLDRMLKNSLGDVAGYPLVNFNQSGWAERLIKAHSNAVENLVVFGALVLVANAAGISNSAIATSAIVYFWARLAHAVIYLFGIPWLRSVAFTVGWGATMVIAYQILF